VPAEDETEEQKARLKGWRVVRGIKGLKNLIDDAAQLLGISKQKPVSRSRLVLEVYQRDAAPLTVVDLPGTVRSHKVDTVVDDIDQIVDTWINNPNSIILAILSASDAKENQGILQKIGQVDPSGKRSFGILTKPDLIQGGDEMLQDWLSMVRGDNSLSRFQKGCHVLKNRSPAELKSKPTVAGRNEIEKDYFMNSPTWRWAWDMRLAGIESLKSRLQILLMSKIMEWAQRAVHDVKKKLSDLDRELKSKKFDRKSEEEMRKQFQVQLKKMSDLLKEGVTGQVHSHFFNFSHFNNAESKFGIKEGEKDVEEVWTKIDPKWLRSRLEHKYDHFEFLVLDGGHTPGLIYDHKKALPGPEELKKVVDRVQEVLRRTVGEEQKGSTDPQRLNLFFWEYSKNWYDLGRDLIDVTSDFSMEFIESVVEGYMTKGDIFERRIKNDAQNATLPNGTSDGASGNHGKSGNPTVAPSKSDTVKCIIEHPSVQQGQEQRKDRAIEALQQLELDRRRPMKIRDTRFSEAVMERDHERQYTSLKALQQTSDDPTTGTPKGLAEKIGNHTEKGKRQSAAEKMIDDALAFYKVTSPQKPVTLNAC